MRATQLGIVSRGRSCGDFNAPGIYTRDEFSFSLINSILIIKYFFPYVKRASISCINSGRVITKSGGGGVT